MRNKIFFAVMFFLVGTFVVFTNNKTFGIKTDVAESMLDENVEALTAGEGSENYNTCYSESKVAKGYTYIDCGSCQKVYDEKGRGPVSKCFY